MACRNRPTADGIGADTVGACTVGAEGSEMGSEVGSEVERVGAERVETNESGAGAGKRLDITKALILKVEI